MTNNKEIKPGDLIRCKVEHCITVTYDKIYICLNIEKEMEDSFDDRIYFINNFNKLDWVRRGTWDPWEFYICFEKVN